MKRKIMNRFYIVLVIVALAMSSFPVSVQAGADASSTEEYTLHLSNAAGDIIYQKALENFHFQVSGLDDEFYYYAFTQFEIRSDGQPFATANAPSLNPTIRLGDPSMYVSPSSAEPVFAVYYRIHYGVLGASTEMVTDWGQAQVIVNGSVVPFYFVPHQKPAVPPVEPPVTPVQPPVPPVEPPAPPVKPPVPPVEPPVPPVKPPVPPVEPPVPPVEPPTPPVQPPILTPGVIQPPPVGKPIAFSDTTEHWAEVQIEQASARSIVQGFPDGSIKPDSPTSRAEFVVLLSRAIGLTGGGVPLHFADNNQIGNWAQTAIANAVQAGIINGFHDGTFRPSAQITRAEMAVMIARALKLTATGVHSNTFMDADTIPLWAKDAVDMLAQLGIVQGQGDNRFAAHKPATRAEAIVLLMRMIEKLEKVK